MDAVCNAPLSDEQFLVHMIPHHQVAIDMSNQLMKVSKDPFLLDLARKIAYVQNFEITIMRGILNGIPDIGSGAKMFYKWNPERCYYECASYFGQEAHCETHFFKTDPEMLRRMNDEMYLEHMIPHHQVAITMSKRLLLHTHSPHMLESANNIIREQEYEIWYMRGLLEHLRKKKEVFSKERR